MAEQTPAAGHTAGRLTIRFSNEYGGFTLSTGVGFVCEYWPPMPDANGAANARRLCAVWNALSDLTTEAIESLTPAHILAAMQHKVAGERVAELEAEVARLKASATKEETTALQLIDERDEAEEAISQAYYLVTGRSPEWSNCFEYPHALAGISEAVAVLKLAVKAPAPDADEIVRRVAELPDRTSPEKWPEAMLVTAEELRQIITSSPAPAPSEEEQR